MTTLTSRCLQDKLRQGVKVTGSFEPDDVLCYIEEGLTWEEIRDAREFLQWMVDNDKTFGWNIPDVVAEFLEVVKEEKADRCERCNGFKGGIGKLCVKCAL